MWRSGSFRFQLQFRLQFQFRLRVRSPGGEKEGQRVSPSVRFRCRRHGNWCRCVLIAGRG